MLEKSSLLEVEEQEHIWGYDGIIEMENAQQTSMGLNGVFVSAETSLMVGEMVALSLNHKETVTTNQ